MRVRVYLKKTESVILNYGSERVEEPDAIG